MKWLRPACVALLLALSFLVLATSPTLLWLDEFLHFALGAYEHIGQAVTRIVISTRDVNFGQTGTHMLVNYILLRAWGASYWAMRLPSYLAAVFGLWAGTQLLARLRVSLVVQLLFLTALGLSDLNLDLGWQSRPYIFLQASVLGFYWAWWRYLAGARRGPAALLLVSLVGVLFHPFFVAYAGLTVLTTAIFFPAQRRFLFAELRAPLRAAMLFAGVAGIAVIGFIDAKFTWLQTFGHSSGFDPYQWIGGERKPLPVFIFAVFFHPFGKAWAPLSLALLAAWAWRGRAKAGPELGRFFLAVLITLLLTQFLVVQSVLRSHYWLLQRQWIAGNALAYLASALLLEAAWRMAQINRRRGLALDLAVMAFSVLAFSWQIEKNWRARIEPPSAEQAAAARIKAEASADNDALLLLAQRNLFEGGPVWPIFRRYYEH